QPSSCSRCIKAALQLSQLTDVPVPRNPMVGSFGCSARAVNVHAAAPPRSVMNSRRLIVALDAQGVILAVPTRCVKDDPMSALGQKQTYAVHKRMSALPPKATSNATYGDVRFRPKADIIRSRRRRVRVMRLER